MIDIPTALFDPLPNLQNENAGRHAAFAVEEYAAHNGKCTAETLIYLKFIITATAYLTAAFR